ncbi:hypothetical protein MAHJHV63_47050 [Mycobacterium avium subsp. hominissuis]
MVCKGSVAAPAADSLITEGVSVGSAAYGADYGRIRAGLSGEMRGIGVLAVPRRGGGASGCVLREALSIPGSQL